MSSIAIIIPCYNEEKRLNTRAFIQFLESHPEVKLLFVNDGSIDSTTTIIEEILIHNKAADLVNLTSNSGKGEAVRQGILKALTENKFDFIGYLDADLSTPLEDFYELYRCALMKNADFIFGSRIQKLGSNIQRSFLRHVIGRIVVTFIDKKFKLGYYDTQCGAKVFKAQILEATIIKPFFTKWFFDIEIFLRLKSINENYFGIEFPLKKWKSVEGSKINLFSFPSVCKEIIVLLSKY